MIVAITGGTGFIGQKLVERHILAGDTVRVLTRGNSDKNQMLRGVEIHVGDLRKASPALWQFVDGADILYHCAGETNCNAMMAGVHVQGTRNLLVAAKGRIGRWVQLSSVGVYGPKKAGTIDEETPLNPRGEYETTKLESDKLVIEAAKRGEINFSLLRPSNVYGASMTKPYFFQLISAVERGRFFYIGPRGASANYIHVDNVVESLLLCGSLPAALGTIFILSDHMPQEQFIEIIARGFGRRPPQLRLPERPIRVAAKLCCLLPSFPLSTSRVDALVTRAVYDASRIEKMLDYKHSIIFKEGLEEMVAAYTQRKGLS